MKDKNLRENFEELCHLFGISYDTMWGKIRINYWNYHNGGNPDLRPIKKEEFIRMYNQLNKRIDLLAEAMKLEWYSKTTKEGYRKIK